MHPHAQWGEVAPLAPLLVLLGEWCMFVVVLGIVTVVGAFVSAVLGAIAGIGFHIPFIGNPVASAVHKAEQAVSHAFGIAEGWIDARIGGAWHEMARLVDWTYKEIRSHANLIYTLGALMVGQAAVGALRAAISAVHGRTVVNEKTLTRTIGRVEGMEHRLAHTITAGVLPRLGRLEREYDRVIDRDIAGLRARTTTAEKSLEDVWKYVRSHPWTLVTEAFVAAVAVALARLGLGWLRCPTAKNVFSKRGCGLWSDLEKLLAAVGEVALVANICQVVPWIEKGFSVVAEPLISTLTGIGAGLCGANSGPPELLPVTTLYLPAATDATLHLP